MKRNRSKRILATILCMVMVLTSNISALAEGEVLQQNAVETGTEGLEATSATVSEAPEEPAPEQPQEPASETPQGSVPEQPTSGTPEQPAPETQSGTPEQPTPGTQSETPEQPTPGTQSETPEQPTPGTQSGTPEQQTSGTSSTPEGSTPGTSSATTPQTESKDPSETPKGETPEGEKTEEETPEEEKPEEPVFSEATELHQDFKDASGKLIQRIKAKLPAGAFEAETSQITMEVSYVDSDMEKYVAGMMEEKLPEGNVLGDYILYKIEFKVNGEVRDSLEPITITFEKSGLEITDTKKANVFYFNPKNEEEGRAKDELVEITQRNEMLEYLQSSGQSTADIEDYDLSSIEMKEENLSGKITLEGRTSTIYGCYVEKEEEKPEENKEETPEEKPEALELTFEDDQVEVKVSAEEAGIIPEGATLKVVPITAENETKEQYEEVAKQIQEKVAEEEKEVAGFLAYDISFVDENGNEVEPNGKVKVSMNYKKAELPKEVEENKATDAEVTVYHLEENENGEVKEVVDMAAEQKATVNTLATTEGAKVQKVEVETDSFSVYAVTWEAAQPWPGDRERTINVVWKDQRNQWNRPTATLHFVDERGGDISRDLNVEDEDIRIPGTGNLSSNYGKDLDAIGREYEDEGIGYYYEAAHLLTYRNKVTASDISYNPNVDRWKPWLCKIDGRYQPWTNQNDVDVYLVYTKEKKQEETLSTVETVDASSKGVTMKMIDLEGNESTTLTNGRTTVNFGGNSGYGEGDRKGRIKKGILNSRIADGEEFPRVKNGDTSLGVLFKGAKDVDQLFRQDIYNETGYFEYSSFENYAYLGDKNTFTVYNQIGTPDDGPSYFYQRGNFMPYNRIENGKFSTNRNWYDENGNPLTRNDPRVNEKLYKTQGKNFQFGMMIEADFTQLRDGQVSHNGTTSDMIYEFNGDDDLWVFIDDVLVLDIGGVHDAHSGSINFATGVVEWWDCTTGGTPKQSTTTLKEIFKKEGVLPSGQRWTTHGAEEEFKGNTFADYTTDHSFKMYYFERGSGASNLHVKFNLPTVPKNTVNVQKVVQDERGEDVTYAEDIDFLFQIEVEDEQYDNQSYTILEGNTEVSTGMTNAKGQFTLKHGQTARFSGINEGMKYQVRELGAYLNGYKVTIDNTEIWTPENGEEISGAVSPEYMVGEKSTVIFINEMVNSTSLRIAKELAEGAEETDKEFKIELKLGGKLYRGAYKIGRITYTAENGIIKLQAGQEAVITGLPYGVTFEARELLDGSYLPTYRISGDKVTNIQIPETSENGTSNGITSASAQINGGDTCTLTVTNKEIPVGAGNTSVAVEKKWTGMSDISKPEYVEVYLYEDVNHDGKLDEGDRDMGYESLLLNEKNDWKDKFEPVPGDKDYVVKEVYPPGYELVSTESDNSFDDIAQIGEHITPNSNLVFDIGVNNFLLVKETGNSYFLWTPVKLNFDDEDIFEIRNTIDELGLEGAGNLKNTNLQYHFGDADFSGINLTEKQNGEGWTLQFHDTSVWAQFWTLSYHRTQSITLTNSLDKDATTSVEVKKEWKGDNSKERPNTVTIQLYQNENPYSEEITLSERNYWEYTFENLPIYTANSNGTVTKNVYTVKETEIGTESVDENGRAMGYQSSVTQTVDENGIIQFIITNAKDWQIVKVSDSSDATKLEGAIFKLTKEEDESFVKWGTSEENGVVQWYDDPTREHTPFKGVFEDGTYTLKEIRSPGGYVISEETWTIVIKGGIAETITSSTGELITKEELDGKDTYYFKNTPLYELPSTGGSGIFVYMISGTLLLMAAALFLYKMKREEVLRK